MRATPLAILLLALSGCVGPAPPGAPLDESPAADPTPTPSIPASSPAASPYAGQETRPIKALSPEEVEGYRAGAGLGYAKSAELNHYPGPLHALELADELSLAPEQRAAISRLREEMLAKAIPLGESYLRAEADIEEAFRTAGLDADALRTLLARAAAIEADLRFVHLDAHLATRALLTPHQVERYDVLRGYAEGAHGGAGHDHGH